MRAIRIPPKSLRKRRPSPAYVRSGAVQPKKLDRILQLLAHISQLGLLILGLFGYFYTVVPVFQNQQLQEQTARLELEKGASEKQLASLALQQARVKEDIRLLQEKWEKEKNRSAQLAGDVSIANAREAQARGQAAETEALLQRHLTILDKARWELVLLDFSFASHAPRLNSTIAFVNAGSESRKDFGAFIASASSRWPQPYSTLLSSVDMAARKGVSRDEIPDSYYAEIREFVKSNEERLHCEKPDFGAMRDEFKAEIAALEPAIDMELERHIDDIKKEYAAKGERVHITEEFRSQSRRDIRFGKVFSVERKFGDRLSALRKACDDKADSILEQIRRAKGVTR